MRAVPLLAAALVLTAGPVLADDDEYGAYLFKGSCAAWAPDAVVEDIGDLDMEDDPGKEWARMAPDNAAAPQPVRIEDEGTDAVTPDQIAAGGYAIAVTRSDDRASPLIACGDIPQGAAMPLIGDLRTVDTSGTAGRFAIEAKGDGVRITVAAFAADAVPALAR